MRLPWYDSPTIPSSLSVNLTATTATNCNKAPRTDPFFSMIHLPNTDILLIFATANTKPE